MHGNGNNTALVTIMSLIALLAAAPQTARNMTAGIESAPGKSRRPPDAAVVVAQPAERPRLCRANVPTVRHDQDTCRASATAR